MVGDSFLDEGFRFREGIGGSYAPREIGQVCGIASGRLLNDGGVFQSGMPKRVGRLKEVLGRLPYLYDMSGKPIGALEDGVLVPFRRR